MNRNPYAPPTAAVADVSVARPAEVNPNVRRACTLMWWQFGASALAQLLQFQWGGGAVQITGMLIGMAIAVGIGFLITNWITSKLLAGRNWMRLLVTSFVILGLLSIPFLSSFYETQVFTEYVKNPIQGVVGLATWILSISSVVLMNTPRARHWFAAMKASGN